MLLKRQLHNVPGAAIHRAAGPNLRRFCMGLPLVVGTDNVRIPTGKAVATRQAHSFCYVMTQLPNVQNASPKIQADP